MGCYNTKQLKKCIETRYRSSTITSATKEEELKNEILLLRNCLFEVLNMKNYQKSLVSIQQDICIIKMKKRNEENLEEIIRCYETNVLQRAREINSILKQSKEIKSDTSLMRQEISAPVLSNIKNIKSMNTNCNSINESTFIGHQNYDIYHVLRYCSSLNLEEVCNIEVLQVEEQEKAIIDFKLN